MQHQFDSILLHLPLLYILTCPLIVVKEKLPSRNSQHDMVFIHFIWPLNVQFQTTTMHKLPPYGPLYGTSTPF